MKASVSQIKAFKACRKAWYFKWCERLIPVQVSEALQIGRKYHAFLETLENGEEIEEEYTKECAMAKAFQKYLLPQIKVVKSEAELELKVGDHILHGFVDGLSEDGCIVEHKTTSMDIAEGGEYEYNLLWDEQVLAYMALTGSRKVYYTVCKKPTIRLKKGESDEEFYHRMIEWYDEDTENKIRVFVVERTDAEVNQFLQDFTAICDEMENCKNVYRNTANCTKYGSRCEYSSICLHYNPNEQYLEFTKKEDHEDGGENVSQ